MGLANSRVVQTPEFLQPNVRRQILLTPNIRLTLFLDGPSWKIGANMSIKFLLRQLSTLFPRRAFCEAEVLSFADSATLRTDQRSAIRPQPRKLPSGLHQLPGHHHYSPEGSGGADRDRTGGLLVANQALSQLSYSPNCSYWLLAVGS